MQPFFLVSGHGRVGMRSVTCCALVHNEFVGCSPHCCVDPCLQLLLIQLLGLDEKISLRFLRSDVRWCYRTTTSEDTQAMPVRSHAYDARSNLKLVFTIAESWKPLATSHLFAIANHVILAHASRTMSFPHSLVRALPALIESDVRRVGLQVSLGCSVAL